ncbi:kinase-like domain-containing protein [Suillus lakei]|nr:kinase-like domain-containing protein [Suillus lakei]
MNTSISPPSEITTTDEPPGEAGQQSARSASGSLQDLTNELQDRSPFAIACGGYGDIYKCYLVKPDGTVPVAVKTIRALQSDNDVLMKKNGKRVRREIKVWGRLKHNSILPLWGVASNFGPYLAMVCPWADNGALTGFLERQEDTLSFEDKFALLTDIALGLQYLHSKSIAHGDLTGSNVLIYGSGRACVTDFGLSTMIEEFAGTSYLTSSIRGNIRWAAAELFDIPEGDEEDDAPVLTCKVPYYDVKRDNVVLGHVVRGKKPELPKGSQIAPVHWEFIQRCWLPRASRPSIGDIVVFAHQQYCEVHSNDAVDSGNSSGNPSGIWSGTWSGNWSGHWSDSDESDVSDDDRSSGTDQETEEEGMDNYGGDGEDSEGHHDNEGDEQDESDEDDEGNDGIDRDDHDEVTGLDGRDGPDDDDDDDSSSGIDQEVEGEDLNEDKIVEGDEGHEGSEDDEEGEEGEEDEDDERSEGVEDEDTEGDDNDEGGDNYESYDDDGDGDWGSDSDGSW